jgi:cytosine/adenosine deaminase-related metal-dependent hydrolase
MRTIVQAGIVVTPTAVGPQVFRAHTVVIEDGVIVRFAPSVEVSADDRAGAEIIDASKHVVIPGLINTHHHLYQSLTRCLPAVQDAPLFDWLTTLYGRWRHVDYDAVRAAASVSIAELLLSGCTTTSDHFYLFPPRSNVRIEAVLDAAQTLGIRIHACRGSMTLGASRGGLPPDDCTEPEERVLRDSRRVIERYHDPSPLAMCKIDLAPCAPFNVSPELLRDTAALARAHGVRLHTHAAETLDEERYCRERFGLRPIEFLRQHDFLGPDVYLAHCVHLNDVDIATLVQTRTAVAHCPCSNMRLASGIAPLRALLDAHVTVGIGVDGSSSNDGGNVLAEARQALLLQRVERGVAGLRTAEAFELATTGGAACLGRDRLGRIAEGMAADLAMFRADDIAFAGAIAQDPLGALVLCNAPHADIVLVAGLPVVRNGRIVNTDQQRLSEELNACVTRAFT